MKRRISISIKLWLAMTLLILTVLGGLGAVITWLFSDFYLQDRLNSLRSDAVETAQQLEKIPDWNQRLVWFESVRLTSGTQVLLIDPQGNVLAAGGTMGGGLGPKGGKGWGGSQMGGFMGGWMHSPMLNDFFTHENLVQVLAGETIANKTTLSGAGNEAMLIAAAPIGQNPVQGVVLLGSSPMPVQASTFAFRRLIVYASLAAILLAAFVSFLLARQVTRPLALMQKAASKMAKGEFEPVTGVDSHDELGDLARGLNSMGESLRNHVSWLSEERNLLKGIVEGISDAVIMLGADGSVQYANEGAKLLWQEQEHEEDNERKQEILSMLRTIPANTEELGQGRILTLGTQVLQAAVAPMAPRGSGSPGGYVAVLRDVTATLRTEKERRDFLASVTHELRTPLHLIQGYLEAIQDGVVGKDDEAGHIQLVLDEAKRLARLVQELQDLNRLERTQTLSPEIIGVADFFQELNQLFQGRAHAHGIKLEFINSSELHVRADRDRLRQVFINLLDNAIRHMPGGGVMKVSAAVKEHGAVSFSISDQGEGIPPESLSKIFDRFYRVDKARSRKEGGMGLGLSIVKQIIDAHGGKIEVESQVGQGTTFKIELP